MFLAVVSLLSRGINLPVAAFISIFFYSPSVSSEKCQEILITFLRAYLFWMCFIALERQKSTIYLITVDNWCAAFAINYGSVESLKNSLAAHYVETFPSFLFASVFIFSSDFFFRRDVVKQLHTSFFGQLQIEFKRCSVVVYFMEMCTKWYKFFRYYIGARVQHTQT